MKKEIRLYSNIKKDFSTKVTIDREEYYIETGDCGSEKNTVITRVYQKGEIVYSHKVSYRDIAHERDFDTRLKELIQKEQRIAIEAIRNKPSEQKRTYKEYIKEIKSLISSDHKAEALELAEEAMMQHPNNPILISYHGLLDAVVNKRYSKGIHMCRQSFKILREQMSLGEGFFLTILYLNLGKAYLAADKKKEAYLSFQRGLQVDKKNEEILCELRKLGMRRKPALPFLSRSNALNKFLGRRSYKDQQKQFHT